VRQGQGALTVPLKKGSSPAVVGANIKELEATGRPPKQAIAISLNEARRTGKGKAPPAPKGGKKGC
jgi:hypothetical protein